jgi:hypothetical protein
MEEVIDPEKDVKVNFVVGVFETDPKLKNGYSGQEIMRIVMRHVGNHERCYPLASELAAYIGFENQELQSINEKTKDAFSDIPL